MHHAFPFALTCLALSSFASFAKEPLTPSVKLGFRTDAPTKAVLTDPRTGKQYEVELDVNPDVNGRAVVVNLVLLRANSDQNLLEPWGNFHGLQPYDFAALGFIRGPEKSPFGSVREIPIRRTATKLVVHIDDVQVRSISAVAAGDHDDAEVTKLQVSVALRAKP